MCQLRSKIPSYWSRVWKLLRKDHPLSINVLNMQGSNLKSSSTTILSNWCMSTHWTQNQKMALNSGHYQNDPQHHLTMTKLILFITSSLLQWHVWELWFSKFQFQVKLQEVKISEKSLEKLQLKSRYLNLCQMMKRLKKFKHQFRKNLKVKMKNPKMQRKNFLVKKSKKLTLTT